MKLKHWLLLFTILIFATACNLPNEISTPEGLETMVVGTLTALAPSANPPTPTKTLTPPALDLSVPASPVPSGLKVAYVKNAQVWLWQEGATPRQLTAAGPVYNLRMSADGQAVVYLRQVDDIHTELWAVNTDGSDERRLVSVADLDVVSAAVRDPSATAVLPYQFSWIPGTHTVAFNTRQAFEGPGLFLFDDLHLVDAETGELLTLFPAGQGGDFTYSPDGGQLAIITPTTIDLAYANGSGRRQALTYDMVNTYSEYHYYARPIWAPDSRALRVAIPPADPLAIPREFTSLWLIPTNGETAQRMGGVLSVPFFEEEVFFSPDTSKILYRIESGSPAENRSELNIAKADGSGAWTYQKGQLMQLHGWGVDSNHFNFSMGDERQAFLGNVDAASTPFTDNPFGIYTVQWVDDQRFLYLRENSGFFEFYLATLNGASIQFDTVAAPPPTYDFAY